MYYTFLRDKNINTTKSYIHINDQLTSPYFLNYEYKLKWNYTIGTLRNFDPIKNYYLFEPKEAPERPLIVQIEALEPCEEYHTYHLQGSVTNKAFCNRIQFNNERKVTETEKEIRNTVKASITDVPIDDKLIYSHIFFHKTNISLRNTGIIGTEQIIRNKRTNYNDTD